MPGLVMARAKLQRRTIHAEHTATCHWTRVDGHSADGQPTTIPVWICEYPYPTMLLERPDDCEGCPLMEKRAAG
jgi:hypothetical protein